MNKKNYFFLRGFTLIELAFVLVIIGVITSAIMKGRDLLDSAKAKSIVADLNRIRMSFVLYHETRQALPGDDDQAQEKFGGNVQNGDGNGEINHDDIQKVWPHLSKSSGGNEPENAPSSKWGGKYFIVTNPTPKHFGHWVVLSDTNDGSSFKGVLTPHQAALIKSKASEGEQHLQKGYVQITEGANFKEGDCVNNKGGPNLNTTEKSCIVLMKLD